MSDEIRLLTKEAKSWEIAEDIFNRVIINKGDTLKNMNTEELAIYYAKKIRLYHDILTQPKPSEVIKNPFYD